MANGPLGGFMPTPAAPAQPPQVKLDTTADSRGNFNNFLKSMNGAMSLNPPSMAPAMGAMAPNMAPALSNIDIFNQPVQMMQFGGEAEDAFEDFGDFSGIDTPSDTSDTNEGASSDNIDDSPPDSDMDYTDVFDTDDFQQATDIGRATSDSTSDGTTIANQNVKFTDLNQNQINEIKSQIANKNEVALAEEDKFFNKDGSMNQAGKDELNKRNAADLQLVSAGQVLPSEYLSTASDILGTGEKSVMDALDLTKPVADPFDMTPFDVRGVPAYTDQIMRGTVDPGKTLTDTSRPFVSFDVGNQAKDIQRALEQGTLAENLDKPEGTIFADMGPQSYLDQAPASLTTGRLAGLATSRDPRDKVNEQIFRETVGDPSSPDVVLPGTSITTLPDGTTITSAPGLGGFTKTESTTRTAADRGLGTSGLTQTDIKNIQDAADRDLLARSVEDKSRIFDPSINIGGVNIPNFLGRGLNKLAEFTDQRVMRGITEKGLIPVVDTDGTITGAKDRFGNLIEGMDFSIQDRATSDSDPTPVIRPLTPKQPEVDPKPDLPPNVIGGTALAEMPQLPTVVESPFTASDARFTPITFDAGDLNKLIEQLVGVPARPVVSAKKGGLIGMANGGLIKAVDDFLAAS